MKYIKLNDAIKVRSDVLAPRDKHCIVGEAVKYNKGQEMRVFISHIVRYYPVSYINTKRVNGSYVPLKEKRNKRLGSVLVDKLGSELPVWQSPNEIDRLIKIETDKS